MSLTAFGAQVRDNVEPALNTLEQALQLSMYQATAVIGELRRSVAAVPGISLYMQPVQDLTIDSSVTRAQYHFAIENPDLATLSTWVPRFV